MWLNGCGRWHARPRSWYMGWCCRAVVVACTPSWCLCLRRRRWSILRSLCMLARQSIWDSSLHPLHWRPIVVLDQIDCRACSNETSMKKLKTSDPEHHRVRQWSSSENECEMVAIQLIKYHTEYKYNSWHSKPIDIKKPPLVSVECSFVIDDFLYAISFGSDAWNGFTIQTKPILRDSQQYLSPLYQEVPFNCQQFFISQYVRCKIVYSPGTERYILLKPSLTYTIWSVAPLPDRLLNPSRTGVCWTSCVQNKSTSNVTVTIYAACYFEANITPKNREIPWK